MRTVQISANIGDCVVMLGERLQNLERHLSTRNAVIIADEKVYELYGKDFPKVHVIQVGRGENIKNLDTVRHIYQKLLHYEVDRSFFIVGIGGGVVCDITGFVASTYLRGLRFGLVASTLLAQVDASIGGKNGVNLSGYKNLVGVFQQPDFVICDLNLLHTLPQDQIRNGLAEIIKHAAIADAGLFSYLERHTEGALNLNPQVIEKLIYDSISIKASIVHRDGNETGERRKLNFGHTFGHAIEKTTGISHGEAVSLGMVLASNLSVGKGLLSESEAERIRRLLAELNLPTRINLDRNRVLASLKKDKKRKGEGIRFVLLRRIGHAAIEKIGLRELGQGIHWVMPR